MQVESIQSAVGVEQQHIFSRERQVLAVASENTSLTAANDERQPEGQSEPEFTDKDHELESSDYRQSLHRRMIEQLAGRELEWFSEKDLQGQLQASDTQSNRLLLIKEDTVDFQAYRFAMELQVQGKDGEQLNFSAELEWQQLNIESRQLTMTEQQLKDPLVLNFDWEPVSFNGHTLMDLDGDGELDDLPIPEGDSGFLVQDLNNNGMMDSTEELIGAMSGDAWADIAAMDSDGNQFIDSRDSAYQQLYWWQPDAGKQMFSLSDKGVDGIFLQGGDTRATLAPEGENVAQLRRTGAFLHHGNQLGVMQQFDFYV